MKFEFLGYIATSLGIISFLPTLKTTVYEKNVSSYTYSSLILAFSSQFFWFIYGTINNDRPVLFLSTFLMIVYIYISYSKYYYEKNNIDKKNY